jgi:hypothetical protein
MRNGVHTVVATVSGRHGFLGAKEALYKVGHVVWSVQWLMGRVVEVPCESWGSGTLTFWARASPGWTCPSRASGSIQTAYIAEHSIDSLSRLGRKGVEHGIEEGNKS